MFTFTPVKAFYDYCVSNVILKDHKQYEAFIRRAYEFGYRTLAFSYVVDESSIKPGIKSDIIPEPMELLLIEGCEDMKLLNRITIIFEGVDFIHKVEISKHYKKYHIVALLPTTDEAFGRLKGSAQALGDIINFDPSQKMQKTMTHSLYSLLCRKGYHFEVLYVPTLHQSNELVNTVAVTHHYYSVGKSKNIIISSGATSIHQLRSAYDIINMGLLFGLQQEQAKNCISNNGRNVFINSIARKQSKNLSFVNMAKKVDFAQEKETNIRSEDDNYSKSKKMKIDKIVPELNTNDVSNNKITV